VFDIDAVIAKGYIHVHAKNFKEKALIVLYVYLKNPYTYTQNIKLFLKKTNSTALQNTVSKLIVTKISMLCFGATMIFNDIVLLMSIGRSVRPSVGRPNDYLSLF